MKKIALLYNALALDVILLALVWQVTFAGVLNVEVPLYAPVILALSIFLVYLLDRWSDLSHMACIDSAPYRYQLLHRYRPYLPLLFGGVLLGDLYLAISFLSLFRMSLSLGLLLYHLLYHFSYTRWRVARNIPKELHVAFIFTAGTLLYLVNPATLLNPNLLACFALGSYLAFLSAALINVSDHRVSSHPASIIAIAPQVYPLLLVAAVLLALTSLTFFPTVWVKLTFPPALALALLPLWKHIAPETMHRIVPDTCLLLLAFYWV